MKFVIENLGQGTSERSAIGDLITKLCALRGTGWSIERRGEAA